ncbi:hypothetical protein Q5P01_014473 [Channa striata]|uniref:Dynein heavy chain 10, axonemal n=1 Tax=Channa striata TaxID=64152 RepID=A0AA88SGS2_CHASR|nr:hypothetical protein Q5P01_014473 [Channa striata]
MTKADASIVQSLEGTVAELTKYCTEAKDNVHFLKTLERYFMNLATGTNFGVILETIPALMNTLQILWIISSHYNTNERMVPLMERIAWQLCERVSQVINVHTIFKEKRVVAKSKVHDAKQILDQWKSSYYLVRAEIEESGKDFGGIYNIFGPEVKGVTGKLIRIDEVLCRVDSLVLPIEEVSFNPFNISKKSSWAMIMQEFATTVQAIDEEAINFIDESFETLRSSADAFKILLKFKEIHSREAINNHFMKKFNDVLVQFCKEVDSINKIFKAEKKKPPLNKNEPPVAGSIKWVRSLLYRIKHTILPFLDVPEIMDSEQFKVAKEKYIEIAVQMREYEEKKYEDWLARTERHLPLLMKKPLLVTNESQSQLELDLAQSESSLQRCVRYVVNFAPEVKEIIFETTNLLSLGYSVPSLAQNVALQDHKFIGYVGDLNKLVNTYHSVLDSLNEAKYIMLCQKIKEVNQEMHFGCKRLNWNCLGISDFIKRGMEVVSKFQTVVNQIQKNERDIESRLQFIAMTNLLKFPVPDNSNDLPGVKEFCERTEQERVKSVSLLKKKYGDIGPLITKTEHLIMETSSGKAKCMIDYYTFWEHKVLDCLLKMVLRSIEAFSSAIVGSTVLFQADVILSAPKIVLQPPSSEIYWLIMQCIKDCIESTKEFVRWMHGTCIECPPQHLSGEDESVIFSFFSDVCQYTQINETARMVSNKIRGLLNSVDRHLNHWKRYRPLWEKDKTIVNEEFAARKPSCVMYDDKLQFFTRIKHEVMLEPHFKNYHTLHLNLEPLARTVWETAESWISSLGSLFNKPAKEDLFNLRDEFMQLSTKLKQSPDSLENLKSVLGTISDIKDMSLDVEIRFTDIKERYRTLAMYKVEVGEDELELVATIDQMWSDLFAESRQVDRGLTNVKKSFTQITKEKIEEFKQELSIFAESFHTHGPGAVGDDLDKGLTIMGSYEADLTKIISGRLELANAEKLLDLQVTPYPELIGIQKDMNGLRQIYGIYKSYKDAKADWSQTLWMNLNIQVLQEGAEGFVKSLRQLPRDIRALPVAFFLDGRMKEFKESLPLLLDLKNEALRDRHWKELMERTGTMFEMNPDSFTLENMFAIELHKYANVIGDIVTTAVKELSIEKGVKEVVEAWENMKFSVMPYFKGTQERGYILGAVDEIQLNVDNDAMNLQSMAGSRFVGPFLGTIQQWEKDLSIISETIEVWLLVQRKWMYLESIFIGGDIRSQLPEEAKKFDNIDKKFKEIMSDTVKRPDIKRCCLIPNRLTDLQALSEGLERCQKSLNDYLDAKRNAFPRFFFISDDELLSILGSSDPACVQEHMIKMYDNIASLRFDVESKGDTVAGAMVSAEGEEMELRKPISVEGKVEEWMMGVLLEMRRTNRLITKEAIFRYCEDRSRVDWMLLYQGMVVLAANQVWWTWEVEDVFKNIKKGEKHA